MTRPESTVKDSVARLIDEIPDRSINARIAELEARRTALLERQRQEREREADLLEQLRTRQVSTVEFLADALMSNPGASPSDAEGLRAQLQSVQAVLEGISLAIRKVERESMQVEAECDGEACRAVAPLHHRNVRITINAVLHLHQATVAQQDLRVTLARRGVERTGHLQPLLHPDFQDGMQDSNSWLSNLLREGVRLGFLEESERIELLNGSRREIDVAS
jgi:hypothetical protein